MDTNARPMVAHQVLKVVGSAGRQFFVRKDVPGKDAVNGHGDDGKPPLIALRVKEYIDIREVGYECFWLFPPKPQHGRSFCCRGGRFDYTAGRAGEVHILTCSE